MRRRRRMPGVISASILTLATGPALAQAVGGDPAHGQVLFQQRCGLCHTAGPQDGDGGQGPPLANVVGRRAGTAPNFSFTAALKASGKVWTPAALDSFLAAPGKDVPGTAMPISTPSPKDRADLIAYLSTVKSSRASAQTRRRLDQGYPAPIVTTKTFIEGAAPDRTGS
jgi:cytochrome c